MHNDHPRKESGMSDIIDITTEIKRKQVDKNCQLQMPDGSTWFKYSAVYKFRPSGAGVPEYLLRAEGVTFPSGQFSVEFWALNDEDAQSRVAAMKETIELEGQTYAEVPL